MEASNGIRSQRTVARSISALGLEPPNPRLLHLLRGSYTASEGQDRAVTAVGQGQIGRQQVVQGDAATHRKREGQ